MKKSLLALLIAITFCTKAGNLTTQVNTDTVVEGESFQLIISTDGQGSEPDLTPLEQNFDILRRSQSSNISIINGNVTKQSHWIVTLSPKHHGKLEIPAIHAGSEQSKAITIQVIDASQAPKSQGASHGISLTMQTKTTGDKLYVFQEIPLTVRIETSQALLQAGIVEPKIEGAELIPIGQDRQSQMRKNGRVINVIERDYSLRAQQAGEIVIKPFTLKGEVADESYRRDPFAEFDQFFAGRSPFGGLGMQRGKPFSVRGNSLTLTIEEAVGTKENQWFLPAKAVELQAKWQEPNPTFRVGEPVTRVMNILALGAQPEQLPTLTTPDIEGLRIYIDSNTTDKAQTTDGTVARREIKLSVVPEYGGEFSLPEVTVNWLNTSTGKAEVATLPAEKITVAGPSAPALIAPSTEKTTPVVSTEKMIKTPTTQQKTVWWWISCIGIIGLGVLGILWLNRRKSLLLVSHRIQRKLLRKAITTAVQKQETKALYQALRTWKQEEKETNEKFNNLMADVESALFHEGALDFQGVNKILDAALLTTKKKTKQGSPLPDLYRH